MNYLYSETGIYIAEKAKKIRKIQF